MKCAFGAVVAAKLLPERAEPARPTDLYPDGFYAGWDQGFFVIDPNCPEDRVYLVQRDYRVDFRA